MKDELLFIIKWLRATLGVLSFSGHGAGKTVETLYIPLTSVETEAGRGACTGREQRGQAIPTSPRRETGPNDTRTREHRPHVWQVGRAGPSPPPTPTALRPGATPERWRPVLRSVGSRTSSSREERPQAMPEPPPHEVSFPRLHLTRVGNYRSHCQGSQKHRWGVCRGGPEDPRAPGWPLRGGSERHVCPGAPGLPERGSGGAARPGGKAAALPARASTEVTDGRRDDT